MIKLSWTDIRNRAKHLVESKIAFVNTSEEESSFIKVFPVTRDSIHAAQAIQAEFYGMFPFLWSDGSFTGGGLEIVEDPEDAHIFIGNIIVTGKTRERFLTSYPKKSFFALINKLDGDQDMEDSIEFPWERMMVKCPDCGSPITFESLNNCMNKKGHNNNGASNN